MCKPTEDCCSGRYGLIGERLCHSHSSLIHSAFGRYSYELIPLSRNELKDFIQTGDFDGLNVTIPYKQMVIPYLDSLSKQAQRIGSVNTIVRRADGTLYGHNTDAHGFLSMVRRANIFLNGQKVLVLGSGGTSRTVCDVVRQAGGVPVIISRNGENHYQNLARHADATVLVNTTPIGMYPEEPFSLIDLEELPGLLSVMDVVYNPQRTRLLQQAQQRGLNVAGGMVMLVEQAAEAYRLFTGNALAQAEVERVLKVVLCQTVGLVLVGMPGSGKSTVGRKAAQMLNLPLIDIDEMIVKETGKTIPEIFACEGEHGFRKLETELLQRYTRSSATVLIAGGGAVLRRSNCEYLRQNAVVVQLCRNLDELSTSGRPLSKNRHALEAMWKNRMPIYAACADVVVENEESLEKCARKVATAYQDVINRAVHIGLW